MGAAPCFFPAPSFALTGLLSSQEAEERDVLGQRMAQGHHIELRGEAGPAIEQRWVSDLSSRLSDPGTPEHPPTHTHERESTNLHQKIVNGPLLGRWGGVVRNSMVSSGEVSRQNTWSLAFTSLSANHLLSDLHKFPNWPGPHSPHL